MLEIEISRRLMSRGAHLLKSSTHSMLYRNSSKFGWFSYHLILHQLSLCPSALKMSSFAYFCNPLIEKTWKTKNVVKWWKDFWWYLITLGIHCDLLCPFTTKYFHWFSYKVWSKRILVSTVINYYCTYYESLWISLYYESLFLHPSVMVINQNET